MDFIKAHKELIKKIMACPCMPLPLGKNPYCPDCAKAVVDFMNQHGAGELTKDTITCD